MAVKYLGDGQYIGLAADTKPTPANTAVGAIFRETDTDDEYENSGSAWVQMGFGALQHDYSYLVYPLGATDFRVKRGSDGKKVYESNNGGTADALAAFQYVRDQLAGTSPGGVAKLLPGYYPLSAKLTFTGLTHQYQSWIGPSSGSMFSGTAHIRASGNFPAIELDGQTNTVVGLYFSGLRLSHDTAAYSNGLIRQLDACVENVYEKIAFDDTGRNVGDCFKIEVLNTTVSKSQYSNRIDRCISRGFDNFINVNMQQNTSTVGGFIGDFDIIQCRVWNAKRVLQTDGVTGGQCLNFDFDGLKFQHVTGNSVAAGQGIFNYDSPISCWYHKHRACTIWDITAAGVNYANIGTSTQFLSLIGSTPTRRLGGAGLAANRPLIFIQDVEGWREPVPEMRGEIIGAYSVTPLGDGLLHGTAFVGSVTQRSDAKGWYLEQATGTTANTSVGYRKGPANWRRDQNPVLRLVGGNNNTGLSRLYFGWAAHSPLLGSDTPLSTTETGFLIGYRGGVDTNYKIFHNNGGGGAMTVLDTGVAISTSLDTILTLYGDVSKFQWSINDSTPTTVSAGTIPGATTGMVFHCIAQNNSTTSINNNMRTIGMKLRVGV